MVNGDLQDGAKERHLSGSALFMALDATSRRELARQARIQQITAGQPIFRAGAAGTSMIAIVVGTVRISIMTPTVQELVLAELTSGDVFGEVALLDGGERSADATAMTNCSLIVVERRSLMGLMQKDPALAIRLLELVCGRLRRSDERMIETAFLELPARLAKTLLRASEDAFATNPHRSARLSLSQSELANWIGGSRESVNRCLRKWQRDGIIEMKDGWLLVHDRAALATLSEHL